MRPSPFTRATLLAAVELYERHTRASFDQLLLRLALEGEDISGSVKAMCGQVGRLVMERSSNIVMTVDGAVTLGEAVVREAIKLLNSRFESTEQTALLRGLSRDGYVIPTDSDGNFTNLRIALPEEVDLPATDNEVNELLRHFGFTTPRGHLHQAIEAHTRGDWAAANSQIRTFLESLFDEIAINVRPLDAQQLPPGHNRRQMLAKSDVSFFILDRNEWTHDGKNYIEGLFKMLHTDGSHPGLSDEDHCTFRLHIVLVTARTFLRRIYYKT